MAFVHLHNHTEYSLLDGMAHVEDLVRRAAELGMPAIAITDHGTMAGAVGLRDACEAVERETGRKVKPIYGCEVYFTTDNALALDGKPKLYHLVLLAKTSEGYRNLLKIVTESHCDNYHYKPRVTLAMLRERGEGLIGMTGCPAGLVPRLLGAGRFKEACKWARGLAGCFAPGDFYVELQGQGPDATAESGMSQAALNRLLADVARECGLETVATNDVHYLEKEDARAHDVKLCIGTGSKVGDAERIRFPNDQFYLKSEAEMRSALAEFPEACDNTVEVAEKCNVELGRDPAPPRFPLPEGETEESWFCHQCETGLIRRYVNVNCAGGDNPVGASFRSPAEQDAAAIPKQATTMDELRILRPDVVARYELERDVILNAGFANYFLVVQEYVAWARSRGIGVGPGRGPAAGSVVAYALGITDVDPVAHGLLFERFVNPDHPEPPDIDLDFEQGRRDEIIAHLEDLYGQGHVARIAAYWLFRAREAVLGAAEAMGYPYGVGDRVARLSGDEFEITPAGAMRRRLKTAYDNEEDVRAIVDAARAIEGRLSDMGVHACGVAMSGLPIAERSALWRAGALEGAVTQLDSRSLEGVGIAKFDLLGLRSLGILSEACRNVELSRGLRIEPDAIPHDDELAFALLRGELPLDDCGLFQLEGPLLRSFFDRVKPAEFREVVAAIALNRPGPLESGMTDDYILLAAGGATTGCYGDERLAPILAETHGYPVYQEQLMQVAEAMCGFSPGEAADLRSALARKRIDSMRRFREKWIDGAAANGFDADVAQRVWDDFEKFAKYLFLKAHATAYAMLAMRTAYMKAHFPAEYMAAVLGSYAGSEQWFMKYLESCRRSGITVLGPDVNLSGVAFLPEGDGVRFGLSGVRALAQRPGLAEAVVAERERGGRFASLEDFAGRLGGTLEPEVVERLAEAGAFDSTGSTRKRAFELARALADDGDDALPASGDEWERRELLDREREALGAYVSAHPLDGYEVALAAASKWELCDLPHRSRDIASGAFAGLVRGIVAKRNKRGANTAEFTLEDKTGFVQCVTFEYDRLAATLAEGAVVKAEGKLECCSHGNVLVVYEAAPIEP